MTTLHRHLAYLEAQGITPLLLRIPVDGALPGNSAFSDIQQCPAEDSLIEETGELSPSSLQPSTPEYYHNISEQLLDGVANKQVDASPAKTGTQKTENNIAAANFNFSVFITGHLLLIDEMQVKTDRRAQQVLLANIAQSLFGTHVQGQSLDLNWPIKDHRSLDNSEQAARVFIHTWIESLVARQHIRFIILLGDSAKDWFHQILEELHLPTVNVAASAEMLENADKKSECWRLIRSYQALVSSSQIDS